MADFMESKTAKNLAFAFAVFSAAFAENEAGREGLVDFFRRRIGDDGDDFRIDFRDRMRNRAQGGGGHAADEVVVESHDRDVARDRHGVFGGVLQETCGLRCRLRASAA